MRLILLYSLNGVHNTELCNFPQRDRRRQQTGPDGQHYRFRYGNQRREDEPQFVRRGSLHQYGTAIAGNAANHRRDDAVKGTDSRPCCKRLSCSVSNHILEPCADHYVISSRSASMMFSLRILLVAYSMVIKITTNTPSILTPRLAQGNWKGNGGSASLCVNPK